MWADLVSATNEMGYNSQKNELKTEFKGWPSILQNLRETWLIYKEWFVTAWTEQHLHFGNTNTNRVEGAHATLKRDLGSINYDFLGMWQMIHPSITVQITEIKVSFERSLSLVKHEHNCLFFQNIRGFVSINALDLIVNERKCCDKVGTEKETCGCDLRRTHGLMCAHEINTSQWGINVSEFLEVLKPLILSAHNVDSDGNCGFRAIALSMGMNIETGWMAVRQDWRAELAFYKEEHTKVFGSEENSNTLMDILNTFDSPCSREKWFLLPNIGFLITSRYQVVLVSISSVFCHTFVPLRTPPPSKPKVIAIGHVNGNHFVSMKLQVGCSIPEPVLFWKKYHHPAADG
ncbi:hypothetical protein IFM89_000522 [Coptis chinensis]|uniref:OTU domain-containing protein n=1 Tax=Coptis chinensis TaxID=261450 RepID=A0A835LFW5_9MAGN|nr:hypothetical protein IFM89_000522 [Coptis chinensis]